jgi:hypothetical protein
LNDLMALFIEHGAVWMRILDLDDTPIALM